MLGRNLMSRINVLLLFSVLSAKTTKILLIIFLIFFIVLGMERKFFDQSQMEDLTFLNTIEHILCSSRQKHGRKKKAFMGPGKVFVSNQWLILGGEC